MNMMSCNICGKELDENDLSLCLNCGGVICLDDFDEDSGFCKNCMNCYSYNGC